VLAGWPAAAPALVYLQSQGITPRALAPYLEKRTSGHNPTIDRHRRMAPRPC
jgi:hypothetical protein